MKKTIAVAVLTFALAACAKSPDAIPPVSMAGAFDGVRCAKAGELLRTERSRLSALETRQRSAVTGDAVGVFLIGVPVSSLSGNDVAGEIGASKGRIVALENRLLTCG